MRTFCLAMILPLALLSCEDGAPGPAEGGRAIGFTTEVNAADTRVAILNLDALKATGFLVNAYSTGLEAWATAKSIATPEFMYNQPVAWNTDNTKWTYAPIMYWPSKPDGANHGKLSFFAWNADTGAELSASHLPGTPTLTYTVPDDYRDQHDLVADVLTDKTVTDGNVRFAFNHTLARIGFTASLKEEYPATTVTVTSLKVRYADNAVQRTGTYTFGNDDHAEGSWLPSGDTYMSHTDDGDEVVNAGVVSLDNSATPQTVRVNSDNSYLMLLPQPITAEAVYIDVSWMVDGRKYEKTLTLPAGTWLTGKRYDYNIRVSLTGITLDPVTVEEWDEGANLTKFYTFTYKANGGTGNDVVQPGATGVEHRFLGADMFTPPAGFAFICWNTQANGSGDNYMPGDQITGTGDVMLYAQWEGSNCYMVAPGGSVTFSVARAYVNDGNGSAALCVDNSTYTGTFSAEVVWQDVDGLTAEVTGKGNTAIVTVQAPNDKGNAVVAIKKGDMTVWSYHIWVTDYNPDTNTYTNPSNGVVFMNRNLGGKDKEASGLYYQWGRKDPFLRDNTVAFGTFSIEAADEIKGTILYTIRHPNVFFTASDSPNDWHWGSRDNTLWGHGTTKSVYDPCPAGWRVPTYATDGDNGLGGSPWEGFDIYGHWEHAGGCYRINGNAMFPAAGWRHFGGGEYLNNDQRPMGFLWSASPYNNRALCLSFGEEQIVNFRPSVARAVANPLRCVRIN